MEQIRIIKEMRAHDKASGRTNEDVRPRFMVWENVPGAFSSNRGEDFRTALEETAKVADESTAIPRPTKGKWTTSGAIVADGWSIAWRVLDAQFWGVPQRRRRIALVADFGGQCAPEILFERKGSTGNPEPCGEKKQAIAGFAEKGTRVYDPSVHHGYRELGDISETVRARYGTGGGNAPIVVEPQIAGTLDSSYYKGTGERNGKERTVVAVDCRNGTESDVNGKYIVRRLTPLECTRLQGYPDGWVDIGEWTDTKGKKHKDADSPKYKALGNSIAIPPWLWVLSRLNEYCEEKTMASLFDGIGGFPLIWEFLNGTGSAVWCSEIEEFPIAVTKIRFPEGEEK